MLMAECFKNVRDAQKFIERNMLNRRQLREIIVVWDEEII